MCIVVLRIRRKVLELVKYLLFSAVAFFMKAHDLSLRCHITILQCLSNGLKFKLYVYYKLIIQKKRVILYSLQEIALWIRLLYDMTYVPMYPFI